MISPAALGLLRPKIVLPTAFAEEASPQALHAVLTHEWAHVRNGDLWLLGISRLLLVVLFAHPLFWWLRLRIRHDQETVADASVAAHADRADAAETDALEVLVEAANLG